jgi:hypothetical protein
LLEKGPGPKHQGLKSETWVFHSTFGGCSFFLAERTPLLRFTAG